MRPLHGNLDGRMAKEEAIQMEGTVTETLPNTTFREELLFGELVSGGHIQITLVEDGLDLTLTPEEESLPPVSAGDED